MRHIQTGQIEAFRGGHVADGGFHGVDLAAAAVENPLDHAQIFTFIVFLTFYVPCLSTFAVMLKTLGRKEAWFSVMISLVSALLLAGAVRGLLGFAQAVA